MRWTNKFFHWLYENYGDYNGQYFYVDRGEGEKEERWGGRNGGGAIPTLPKEEKIELYSCRTV
jgi:hypothetical protein